MKKYHSGAKRFIGVAMAMLFVAGCFPAFLMPAYAKETPISVKGTIYEFDSKDHYEFLAGTSDPSGKAFGSFTISGKAKLDGTQNGLPRYTVNSEDIKFHYTYDNAKLAAAETEWHLIEDKTKKVDDITLDKNIMHGAIIVQSSKNGTDWITDTDRTLTDVFTEDTELPDKFYESNNIQLENGCYYRVIVAYKLKIKTGEKKTGPFTSDITEEKKVAEVYEFYAAYKEQSGKIASAAVTPRKEMGQKVKTELDKGYAINQAKPEVIDKNDPHYGWDLGTFVINGYTREISSNGVPVFLKNVGDKVTLWFTLTQDINKLSEKSTLTISEDTNGYDQFFEIPQTNFKHGMLIIRFTDHEGKAELVKYTDFLAANATTGADTKVQLFEEGDYEVSLDYEIKKTPKFGVPSYTNYKISFAFSIRNGNCKVFPFDAKTGVELRNSKAPNGFKLDMARSRYLTIDVTRTVLNIGTDGLIAKDERFNRPAKDNDTYTDEGIYIFKVKNLYTDETSTKIIFVGTNKYLLALAKNTVSSEKLDDSIKALNEQLSLGATIKDDGTIVPPPEPEPEPEPEPSASEEPEPEPTASEKPNPEPSPSISGSPKPEEPSPKESESQPVISSVPPSNNVESENPKTEDPDLATDETPQSISIVVPIVVISVIAAGGIIFTVQAKKKKNSES